MPSRRLVIVLAALAAALLIPASAGAYQLFSSNTGGTGVSPNRWQSLPIAVTVDNGPTDVLAEVQTALTTWNAVTTAQDPWGTATKAVDGDGNAVDFTGANMGTAWGKLTGDGQQEVVFDEDGSALTALGLAPGSVNGYGPSRSRVVGGTAVIDDMYLIVNGSRTNFDRQATEVHELGHTLGLAHSSVGFYLNSPTALSPVTIGDVPTMHPYSVGGGTQRRTLEADDRASLSELYPEATFTSTLGTISGKVTRCETDEPVLGVNVRAVNTADPAIQLTRVTGFDGRTDGSYEIRGVPPGNYKVLVEPLSGNADYLGRLAMYTRVDTDFLQEFHNASKEADCGEDSDPDANEPVAVGAGGGASADFKVNPVELALVVDDTGSMGEEIGAIRTALQTYIDTVRAANAASGKPFPNTAILSFKDNVTIRKVSRDPDALKTVVAGLAAGGGGDCPEASNAALVSAGRMLVKNGTAVMATDADSRPDGPSADTVAALFRSKGARLSVILSGNCEGEDEVRSGRRGSSANSSQNDVPLQHGDETAEPPDLLGVQNPIQTFSGLTNATGGLFSYQPGVKNGSADTAAQYANTLANVAISAVKPAIAGATPSDIPRNTTLDVELTGSKTNFNATSVAEVRGDGVQVLTTSVRSPTLAVVRLAVAADAPLGFRDVRVSTDLGDGTAEVAEGLGAVRVVDEPAGPTILGVSPSAGEQGKTLDVTISAAKTNFVDGTSVAAFGPGVTVNATSVTSPTTAVANVTVAPDAQVGLRSVTVTTGAEVADESVPGPFLVKAPAPAIPQIVKAEPAAGSRASTVDVVLTGENTTFADGTSVAAVSGAGVNVLSTTVESPTRAVARMQIASDAPLGFRDVTVTTGAETAALLNGFQVLPEAPIRSVPGTGTGTGPGPGTGTGTGPGTSGGPLGAARARLGRTLRFRKGRLEVQVSCAKGRKTCKGSATASVRIGRRSLTLAKAGLSIPSGRSKTVRLKPRRAVLRRAHGRKLPVRVAVRLDNRQQVTLSKRLRLPRR